MDGRTDGRTDGRKDGRTDGRTDGRKDGWTEGRTDTTYYRDAMSHPKTIDSAGKKTLEGRCVFLFFQ